MSPMPMDARITAIIIWIILSAAVVIPIWRYKQSEDTAEDAEE